MTVSRFSASGSIVWGAAAALALLLAAEPASALTLSTAAAADFEKAVAAESLSEPVDVAELPDGRLVVIQRAGDVLTFTPGTPDPVENHIDVDSNHNERGLLGGGQRRGVEAAVPGDTARRGAVGPEASRFRRP